MDAKDLQKLKRTELQKLAKQKGIKANRKNAEIVEELLQIMSRDDPKMEEKSFIEKNKIEDSEEKQQCENGVKIARDIEQKERTTLIPKKIPVATGKKKINWQEIHNKSFGKMESIDDYIQRKKIRSDQLKSNIKSVAKDARAALSQMQNTHNTPTYLKENNKEKKTITPKVTTSKSPFRPPNSLSKPKKFIFNKRPSCSVPEITVKDGVKDKLSCTRGLTTPLQRQSLNVSCMKSKTSSLQRAKKISHQPSSNLNFRSPILKPSQLNTTVTSSAKKFDLKESLKKPLPYKPHYGKLKNVADTYATKENNTKRRAEVKTIRKTQTRSDRRAAIIEKRKEVKNKSLDRRRGIVQ